MRCSQQAQIVSIWSPVVNAIWGNPEILQEQVFLEKAGNQILCASYLAGAEAPLPQTSIVMILSPGVWI